MNPKTPRHPLASILLTLALLIAAPIAHAQEKSIVELPDNLFENQLIFDDTLLLDGYANKYRDESKIILLQMIRDDNLSAYKMAAAIRVFKENYALNVFSKEKRAIAKTLLRRLHRSRSAFVQVEIMHTLCLMDRFRYFNSMVPALILKLDHYNDTVNAMTYQGLNDIIERGNNRAREARIVFNTLRKIFFLMRKRLAEVTEPDERLQQKLKLIRWSTKVLGIQELRKLPKEVIDLL